MTPVALRRNKGNQKDRIPLQSRFSPRDAMPVAGACDRPKLGERRAEPASNDARRAAGRRRPAGSENYI